jgi:hypothetical protein
MALLAETQQWLRVRAVLLPCCRGNAISWNSLLQWMLANSSI